MNQRTAKLMRKYALAQSHGKGDAGYTRRMERWWNGIPRPHRAGVRLLAKTIVRSYAGSN